MYWCRDPKYNSCSLLKLDWNALHFFILPEAKLGKDLEDIILMMIKELESRTKEANSVQGIEIMSVLKDNGMS